MGRMLAHLTIAAIVVCVTTLEQVCLERADSSWGQRNETVCDAIVTMSSLNSAMLKPGDSNFYCTPRSLLDTPPLMVMVVAVTEVADWDGDGKRSMYQSYSFLSLEHCHAETFL